MNQKSVILVTLFLVGIPSLVSSSGPYYVFIIDEEGKTQLKYQEILSVSQYGYYLPASETSFAIPENVSNLEFYDSYGKITPRRTWVEKGYIMYLANTREVEYNMPYEIGYTYDLPRYTTVRYKENYYFEYPFYLESDSESEVKICIPSRAIKGAKTYDSTPIDEPKEVQKTNPFTSFKFESAPELSFIAFSLSPCSSGYREYALTNFKKNISEKVSFDFNIPGEDTSLFTYNGKNVFVQAPIKYQEIIEKNVKKIDSVLPAIDSKLNLNSPSKYNLYFVSDSDKVLQNGNFMVSYADGRVFYQVSLVRLDDDQFIQINLLRGMINSAILNTYGEDNTDNWWTDGALAITALKLMKEEGLTYIDVQNLLDEIKTDFKRRTAKENIDLLNEFKSEDTKQLLYSSIVDEIEEKCPEHILKINKIAKETPDLAFSNEKEFNNYLLYNLKEICGKDISPVLDKFLFEHDDTLSAKNRYDKINEKIQNIKTTETDVKELDDAKYKLINAENNLKKGKISEALESIEEVEASYERILETIAIRIKIEELRPKLNAIPSELQSVNILTATNNLDQAENLVNKKDTKGATEKLKESESSYETTVKQMGGILQEYVDAKVKTESVPGIFYLPSKPLAKNSLSSAADNIKKERFTSAREAINNSIFWSNNAIILSLILYVIIIAGISVTYLRIAKPKLKQKTNNPQSD